MAFQLAHIQAKFMKKHTNYEGVIFPGGSGSYMYGNNFPLKIKEKKMTKFNLEIKPAVPIELRHKIAELIEQQGYSVWAQGQFTDNSVCDINFETKGEIKNEVPKNS